MERGGLFTAAFWRRVVGKTPFQKVLGTVVLRTIFILLGLRGSYSAPVGNSLVQIIASEAVAYVVSRNRPRLRTGKKINSLIINKVEIWSVRSLDEFRRLRTQPLQMQDEVIPTGFSLAQTHGFAREP